MAGPLPPGSLIDSLHGYYTQLPTDPFANLISRERQIVAVTIERNGAPSKRLVESLGISDRILRKALPTIYAKTGVATRLQLVALTARAFAETLNGCGGCHVTHHERYKRHVRAVTPLPVSRAAAHLG